MNRIECALKMARMGWPVFPLVPGGRAPYADEGVSVATTDAKRIRAWFASRPFMNYGVCTTGGVVLDLDKKPGNPSGLEAFDVTFGDLPNTFTVESPSGGLHLYFEHEGCGQAPLLGEAGVIDVRSFNGYVVGPGSSSDAGGVWRIIRDVPPIRPAPAIAERLSPVPSKLREAPELRRAPLGELDSDQALEAGKRYLEKDAPSGQHGSRNETGYRVACTLKDLGLSEGAIGDLMAEHWDVQLSDDFDIETIYELGRRAHKSGQNRPGVRAVGVDFDFDELAALDELFADGPDPADDAEEGEAPASAADPRDALAELRQHAAQWFEPFDPHVQPEDLAPRRWFVTDVLMPGQVTGVVAAPGLGKSTLMLTLCAGLAAGDLSALGMDCPEGPKRCLFLSTEEDRGEMVKRAWAACEANGLDRDAIGANLILPRAGFDGLALLKRDREHGRTLVESIDVHALSVFCHDNRIDVLVLDPWVEMTEAEENSNPEVKQAIALVRSLCRKRGMAGVVIHHSRKGTGAGDAGNADTARGAGALNGALRAQYTLVRPSADDMAAVGMTEDQAAAIFRFDRAKGSYSKPGKSTKWFQNQSVAKPNADGTLEEVGAVVAYDMAAKERQAQVTLGSIIAAAAIDLETGEAKPLPLKDAVAAVQADPQFGNAPPAKIKQTLEALFARGPAITEAGTLALRQFGALRAFELTENDPAAVLN